MNVCPKCAERLQAEARVCRQCLHVIDPDAWRQQHDAGRLGADNRGGGRPIEDPPVGPIPLQGSQLAGGAIGAVVSALRSVVAALLALPRRRRG